MILPISLPAFRRAAQVLMISAAVPAVAQAEMARTLNFNGVTGIIDMPSGGMQPDGELGVALSHFGGATRTTLTFQIAPRIQGSFRYSGADGLAIPGANARGVYYDRSFDVRFQILQEGQWLPDVTIGLQDLAGTGVFASEYIAATKTFQDRVRVTAGLGWGRMGSHGAIGSTGKRPGGTGPVTGGTFNYDRWFRGPVAPFAGVEWQVNDRLGLKAEYSSDAYTLEAGRFGLFKRRSSVNFGAEYLVTPGLRLGAYYLYGSELGLMAQIALNPKSRPIPAFVGGAPTPVTLRPTVAANPGAWSNSWAEAGGTAPATALRAQVEKTLKAQGIVLDSLAVDSGRVEVRVRNPGIDAPAQMVGRVARALTATMPASVETFDVVPVVNGMATSRIRLKRSDVETLEHAPDNAAALRARVQFQDAAAPMTGHVPGVEGARRLAWGISPFARVSFFDPSEPLRIDAGIRGQAQLRLAQGLYLTGSATQRVVGNLKDYKRPSNSVLPHVRTDDYLRDRRGFALESLALAWYSRPMENVYGRVTAGYLERGYGGVSAEVLWKPVNSRLALGAEINHVKQRALHKITGFEKYSVTTGHVSAYYQLPQGYHAQLDVGRYLAGDVGATISFDREFANGWRVGAFATKTNVSAATFGEGSFDKGIRITVPMAWLSGTTTRAKPTMTIRPIQRDGGARVSVEGRLYDAVRGYHAPRVDTQWGRVWR